MSDGTSNQGKTESNNSIFSDYLAKKEAIQGTINSGESKPLKLDGAIMFTASKPHGTVTVGNAGGGASSASYYNPNAYHPNGGVCPSCGHCPTCGRRTGPWYPSWSWPQYTNTPTITC